MSSRGASELSAGDADESQLEEEEEEEEEEECRLRNGWLRHMLLDGGSRDRPGVRVRPVETNDGFDGVDFVSRNSVAHARSWVMGPLLAEVQV